ncbi:MAG: hypothetical protein LW817_08035, partial [Candidatus Caenarcaniphilales bacterium]|nr:hypothetical protein [Candidatus Caenarcaniphilales bacterium]
NFIKNNFEFNDESRQLIQGHLQSIAVKNPNYQINQGRVSSDDFFPFTNEQIKKISSEITSDSPPYPLEGKDKGKRFRESQQKAIKVAKRASQTYFSFPALTFDAKKIIPGKESTLAEYAQDFFEAFDRLNHSKIDKYPGNGFCLRNLKIPAILGFGDINEKSHPLLFKSYQAYADELQKSCPWLSRGLEDANQAEYIVARGFQAVIPPSKKGYFIKDQNGQKIHYSYIVFNQHFNQNTKRTNKYDVSKSFLVPTKVLRKFIDPYRISSSNYTGFNGQLPDFCDSNITREALEYAAEQESANILNLSWASNLGGLANTFPPRSKPYHAWEIFRQKETKDKLGHVHKSHILGGYNFAGSKEDLEALKSFREAENDVYSTSDGCQQLIYMFNLGLAHLHKGIAVKSDSIEDQEIDFTQSPIVDPELINLNAKNYMLQRALEIHESLHSRGAPEQEYPLLLIGETFNNGNRPQLYPALDTYDLKLRISEEKSIDLSVMSREQQELFFMQHFIESTISKINLDLRFYAREGLGSKANQEKTIFDKIAFYRIL